MGAHPIVRDNMFEKSRELHENLVSKLTSREVLSLDHASLERLVEEDGRELLRQMLQDHLNYRGSGEAARAVVGEDGVGRTHRRERTRGLQTLFGPVAIHRICYGARGYESLCPLDAELNLPEESYSLGIRRRVAVEASKVSFDEVVKTVAETTGTSVPKRQAEQLARLAAVDFDDFYEQRKPAANSPTGKLVVVTTDSKGIVVRNQDLRDEARRDAERFKSKLEKRRSRGEKAGRKRMAQVAAVYTVDPFTRTAADIIGELRPTENRPPAKTSRPKPQDKRVWASITHEPKDVIAGAFEEAARRDPERVKDWVVLVDGYKPQLDRVLDCIPDTGTEPTIIVDVIHVLEHMWSAAQAIHGQGAPKAEEWVTRRLRLLLEGVDPCTVAAGIRRSATKHGVTGSRRKNVESCARYLRNHADYLHYDRYLAAGYPIATGVIEGACRHLIKDRMDITGARWSLDGAEALLRLRALRSSGHFDAYWAFHERRELARNHLARYAAGTAPVLAKPANIRPRSSLRLIS